MSNNYSDIKEERDKIICRCEEVTEAEIRAAIRKYDLDTVSEVKRATRAGMGLCQGRSCEPTIKRIIAQETGKKLSEIGPDRSRPPSIPVEVSVIGDVIEEDSAND